METCEIKGVKIGEGIPKICVPIVKRTISDIVETFRELNTLDIDCIEFRIDYYPELTNVDQLFNELDQLSITKPVIFTCRTVKEGGLGDVSLPEYKDLYLKALQHDIFDIYDIELNLGTNMVVDLVEQVHQHNKKVLISYHDFKKTHQRESVASKLDLMQSYNGDIYKIAMMPEDINDVLNVIDMTNWAQEEYDKPIVTMSMSSLGLMTRFIGEQIGSAITFASYGEGSAPGQIDYKDLKTILNIIHKAKTEG